MNTLYYISIQKATSVAFKHTVVTFHSRNLFDFKASSTWHFCIGPVNLLAPFQYTLYVKIRRSRSSIITTNNRPPSHLQIRILHTHKSLSFFSPTYLIRSVQDHIVFFSNRNCGFKVHKFQIKPV
ncbi:hypothetical protein HanRHA438_Chr06g0252421 [Helianthus annuus]|nr:hypothetical protein HanRHA438_Chr06g0252421 [Helianthus annuus]